MRGAGSVVGLHDEVGHPILHRIDDEIGYLAHHVACATNGLSQLEPHERRAYVAGVGTGCASCTIELVDRSATSVIVETTRPKRITRTG
jgi:hypothetical protein